MNILLVEDEKRLSEVLVKILQENKYTVDAVKNGSDGLLYAQKGQYDVIILGTPVWWYTMASPVKTFLKENNTSGKTIIPFCTHGGGGASSTFTDMAKLAPEAKVLEGFEVYERGDNKTDEQITEWLSKTLK